MDNQLQDLVAAWSAYGKQQPQPRQAYSSMSYEPQQAAPPMRGSFSAPGPDGGGPDPSPFQMSGWGGNAPGYRPGIPSQTPGQIDANDRAWEEKQRMWDAEEARKNALEEQSYAQSRLREGAGPPAMQSWQKYQDVMAQPYQRPAPPQMSQMNDYSWQPPQQQQGPAMGWQTSVHNLMQNQPGIAAIIRALGGMGGGQW